MVSLKVMEKPRLKGFLFALLAVLFLTASGCEKKVRPAEGPEEVVEKFYAYIQEGGSTTLSEAFRLVDEKLCNLSEAQFKDTVTKYPKDMDVKILGSTIDDEKDIATVSVECSIPSSFGGSVTTRSDLNLKLDKEQNRWKIDFTGETSDEDPDKYKSGSESK